MEKSKPSRPLQANPEGVALDAHSESDRNESLGNPDEEIDYAERVAQSIAEGIQWARTRANREEPEGQFDLGSLYYHGYDIPQDYAEAANWILKAAIQGYPPAQYLLGEMYDKGQGFEKDQKKAVRWLRKAAKQGDGEAQESLGLHFYYGWGLCQNFSKAFVWLTLATLNRQKNSSERSWAAEELSTQALKRAELRAQELHEEIRARSLRAT